MVTCMLMAWIPSISTIEDFGSSCRTTLALIFTKLEVFFYYMFLIFYAIIVE